MAHIGETEGRYATRERREGVSIRKARRSTRGLKGARKALSAVPSPSHLAGTKSIVAVALLHFKLERLALPIVQLAAQVVQNHCARASRLAMLLRTGLQSKCNRILRRVSDTRRNSCRCLLAVGLLCTLTMHVYSTYCATTQQIREVSGGRNYSCRR